MPSNNNNAAGGPSRNILSGNLPAKHGTYDNRKSDLPVKAQRKTVGKGSQAAPKKVLDISDVIVAPPARVQNGTGANDIPTLPRRSPRGQTK